MRSFERSPQSEATYVSKCFASHDLTMQDLRTGQKSRMAARCSSLMTTLTRRWLCIPQLLLDQSLRMLPQSSAYKRARPRLSYWVARGLEVSHMRWKSSENTSCKHPDFGRSGLQNRNIKVGGEKWSTARP